MVPEKVILTSEGLKKLQEEMENLKTVRRADVAEKLKEARAQGDLSENAEYDAAKDEQAEIEARIGQIEALLLHVEVVDESKVDTSKINIGCRVTVKFVGEKEEEDYWIVGSTESDALENKVSNESPIGAALLGHKIGEVVEAAVPNGILKIEIIKIHR